MTTFLSQKVLKKYVCENCDYSTPYKKDFLKHLQTKKHKKGQILQNATESMQKVPKLFTCECGKTYSHHSSLYKHKKSCKKNQIQVIDNVDYKSMFLEIVKENKEMRTLLSKQQEQITEIIPKMGNNINNNSNNNIKQKFNINLFLNEKCKDALSIDQFIDKIEISMKNLLTTSEKGQVQGITDIFIDNMSKLSLYERPLHCTDKKRETLYIKNDQWKKDDDKSQINDAIKKIEAKQFKNIKTWVDAHPNYMTNEKEQDEFLKIVKETSYSIEENREKVRKNITNSITLDKDETENQK